MSYPEIARALGRRDHDCAREGVMKIQRRVEADEDYLDELWDMVTGAPE